MNTANWLRVNTKSVRFRLTALYSSTLIFSLAVLFISFYWVTQRELYNHTDVTLQSHATRIITILRTESFQIDTQMSSQLLTEVFSETPGMLVFIVNNDGDILSVSQHVPNASRIIASLLEKNSGSEKTVFENQNIGSMDMRFILTPVGNIGAIRDYVVVGHPIDVIKNSLRALYGSLTVVFLSFVIPTIVGGFMLAGSALTPVAQLSRQMEEISSENLKRRVSISQTGDEIETLSHTFNTLLDRLEESFMNERQFIGDIAHELKTPLATLKGGIEVALSKKRSVPEYERILDDLLIDANRLSTTLTHILDLAWSKSDSYETTKDATNLSNLVKEIAEVAQKLAYRKQISITSHIENNLIIRGKKEKIFRAILNVVDNAVKYSGVKRTIGIKLYKKNNHAMVQIKDTGRGIAKEDLPHVFDRFYRGSKIGKTMGSGLGLSIARAIITSCGGHIDIESFPGKGTVVAIVFPLKRIVS